eukprot:TRINITY_DN59627_c0_g1_i1.p1 TRINITY_DN59627_c0_g1~~TRINITY_DN59627_c0_g1_i1.p1  ORF type:complete len:772 (-),score=151.40 TRINITY_DN59627_c0_g1_i1:271-2586(-)
MSKYVACLVLVSEASLWGSEGRGVSWLPLREGDNDDIHSAVEDSAFQDAASLGLRGLNSSAWWRRTAPSESLEVSAKYSCLQCNCVGTCRAADGEGWFTSGWWLGFVEFEHDCIKQYSAHELAVVKDFDIWCMEERSRQVLFCHNMHEFMYYGLPILDGCQATSAAKYLLKETCEWACTSDGRPVVRCIYSFDPDGVHDFADSGLSHCMISSQCTAKMREEIKVVCVPQPTAPQDCDEQLLGIQGDAYRGCQLHTRSGRLCQKWSSQEPHQHTLGISESGLGAHRYCRNPDKSDTIWCYTSDPLVPREYCEPLPTIPPTPYPTPMPPTAVPTAQPTYWWTDEDKAPPTNATVGKGEQIVVSGSFEFAVLLGQVFVVDKRAEDALRAGLAASVDGVDVDWVRELKIGRKGRRLEPITRRLAADIPKTFYVVHYEIVLPEGMETPSLSDISHTSAKLQQNINQQLSSIGASTVELGAVAAPQQRVQNYHATTTAGPVDLGDNDVFVDTVSSFDDEGDASEAKKSLQDEWEDKLAEVEEQHEREKWFLQVILGGVTLALFSIICCACLCCFCLFCRPRADDKELLQELRASRISERKAMRETTREHRFFDDVSVVGSPATPPAAGAAASPGSGEGAAGIGDAVVTGPQEPAERRPGRKTAPVKSGRATDFTWPAAADGGAGPSAAHPRFQTAYAGSGGPQIATLPRDLRAIVLDDIGSDSSGSIVLDDKGSSGRAAPGSAAGSGSTPSRKSRSLKKSRQQQQPARTRESLNSME